jgi:hypothetical protein
MKAPNAICAQNDFVKWCLQFFCLLVTSATASAQLAVMVSPVKVTGQKAVVPLALKNNFGETIQSARAVVFLADEQGKVQGRPVTRWVIGGRNTNGLPAGATNAYFFVVATDKPFPTTNLTAKVAFNRVVLEGGKLADVTKDVQIEKAPK